MKINVRVRQTAGGEVPAIPITTEYIRLDALLKLANLVESGGMAKNVIQDGQVKVNGQVCAMRGKKLYPGDVAAFGGQRVRVTDGRGTEEHEAQ